VQKIISATFGRPALAVPTRFSDLLMLQSTFEIQRLTIALVLPDLHVIFDIVNMLIVYLYRCPLT
jgi:hypothetical protein